jgi:hypothetical protein
MFTENDLQQIASRGSDAGEVQRQIERFKKGFPYIHLRRPAGSGDGIRILSEQEVEVYDRSFEAKTTGMSLLKFVPASGAASRMFKELFSFMETYSDGEEACLALHENPKMAFLAEFFDHIEQFAFYPDLRKACAAAGKPIGQAIEEGAFSSVLGCLLGPEGLNYGNLPKGLLKFHRYGDATRTPLEEHLVEGAQYARDSAGVVRLHFTVSPEHRERFVSHIEQVQSKYEELFGVRYQIHFSEQKAHTDTVAVQPDNELFREKDGSLLFRPAGHGALIENLNDLEADLIFIKNIDNVVPDRLKRDTVRYKRALAGVLLDLKSKIDRYMKKIEKKKSGSSDIPEMLDFIRRELHVEHLPAFADDSEALAFAFRKFNRPLRVCGMVRNQGEPGGGPFFARNPDGTVSLQVVESSQVDNKNEVQKGIASRASHFNPVDLVCSIHDYRGRKYDLRAFIDPDTGFISTKSKSGRELKALEVPGLWNGAMSDWNTVFVEVPVQTFNPVKTVNDLLREEHR